MNPHSLPLPAGDAQILSEALSDLIRNEIRSTGVISFERFMRLALYEPGLGYYSAGSSKFGEAGDFVTAPEISPLFSRCLARQCRDVLSAISNGHSKVIMELGAGSGVMAADVLLELEGIDSLPDRYLILEVSADLRERQQKKLAAAVAHLLPRVEWLDCLPEYPLFGCILANEVVDALPVERFVIGHDGLQRVVVGLDGDRFCFRREAMPEKLARAVSESLGRPLDEYPVGYQSEWCPTLVSWTRSVASCLREGMFCISDYGLSRQEYYHPDRVGGTLLCHYRHRAHDDAFFWPGLQDITAWVDFSAIAAAGEAEGLNLAGFSTQAHWLMSLGLDELVARQFSEDQRSQLELAGQVKTLTLPGEMGERFKVMALTRGVGSRLRGFALRDFSDRL